VKNTYLEFEQPIAELEEQIEKLRYMQGGSALDISEEIAKLEKKLQHMVRDIYKNLSSWQITQVARHPNRPYALDYIQNIFSDFKEFKGDRHFRDDTAICGGIARIENIPVMVIGQQKGRDVKEKIHRNFGMPRPEGYRKALRLAKLAEKFGLPVITLVDTPGAYPGIDAEERNQSEAIARNLYELSILRTPILCCVIGEGGSGGALALSVSDWVGMLSYSVYSVISPEGCASILWKSAEQAPLAAEKMGITATKLKELGLIDAIIEEPEGGAHRNWEKTFAQVRQALLETLFRLRVAPLDNLLSQREKRLLSYGVFQEV
jgi:acetyl-CoA carboxylase carboxyl transferase subunit alpha